MRLLGKLTLLLTVAISPLHGEDSPSPRTSDEPPARKVRVTISEKTTVITEPLRKDGYPDYIEALNRKLSNGVTPDSNAAVLIWKVVGPAAIEEPLRPEYFRRLGMEALPAKGEYFQSLPEFAQAHPEIAPNTVGDEAQSSTEIAIKEELDRVTQEPWSNKDFPLTAAWIAASESHLKLVREASRRPHRYDPCLAQGIDATVLDTLLPALQKIRDVARITLARAMLRLNSEDTEGAADDLLTCHHLARLAGEHDTSFDLLVGIAIHAIAAKADQQLLAAKGFSADNARYFREELRRMPDNIAMVRSADRPERWMFLDVVCRTASKPPDEALAMLGIATEEDESKKGFSLFRAAITRPYDADVLLTLGNPWYDRVVEKMRMPPGIERTAAMKKVMNDFEAFTNDGRAKAKWQIFGSKQQRSEAIALLVLNMFFGAYPAMVEAEDRYRTQCQILDVALALHVHKSETGKYPTKRDELVPDLLTTVPIDLFAGTTLQYQSDGSGYLLYSVGPNAKDDDGRGYDDAQSAVDEATGEPLKVDDISIRMPLDWTQPPE